MVLKNAVWDLFKPTHGPILTTTFVADRRDLCWWWQVKNRLVCSFKHLSASSSSQRQILTLLQKMCRILYFIWFSIIFYQCQLQSLIIKLFSFWQETVRNTQPSFCWLLKATIYSVLKTSNLGFLVMERRVLCACHRKMTMCLNIPGIFHCNVWTKATMSW